MCLIVHFFPSSYTFHTGIYRTTTRFCFCKVAVRASSVPLLWIWSVWRRTVVQIISLPEPGLPRPPKRPRSTAKWTWYIRKWTGTPVSYSEPRAWPGAFEPQCKIRVWRQTSMMVHGPRNMWAVYRFNSFSSLYMITSCSKKSFCPCGA